MKVILATDGSQYAQEAAWLLAHLPHSEKLELTVLFVSNVPTLRGGTNIDELRKSLEFADKQKSISLFEDLKTLFEGANAKLEMVVGDGHVGTKIVRTAEKTKCDLIVLGAIGHSLFERMFGSTSDFVATHADCSVLVVRPTGLRTAMRPIDVCIGFDETDTSSNVLNQLSQFCWGANTKMEIATVVSMPFIYTDIPYEFFVDEIKSIREQELEREANRFREISPIVSTHIIEANHVGDALVQFAKRIGSDILIVGNTGGGLLGSFLLGSVSKYVLRHAECSVWIARKKSKAK
jgi:nucleotide-binding universal stress UspA family protein